MVLLHHNLWIYANVQIPLFPYQPLVFAFFNSTTRLVEYREGWLVGAFTFIAFLTNPSSQRLNMRIKVIGAKVWYLLRDVCLAYLSHNLSPIFHSSFEPSFVHFKWKHPPILNQLICLCFVCQEYRQVLHAVKKPRGRILFNLHRIMEMFFSIINRSLTLRVDEHKTLKYSLSSVSGFQT